jgi:DNA invertase Pin-like site-specific DNA recombinase
MLTVLGGLAEFERDLIRAHTGEGRARAVARGQKMGRQFKLTDHQKREAVKRRNQGETLADIAPELHVSPADDFTAHGRLTYRHPYVGTVWIG